MIETNLPPKDACEDHIFGMMIKKVDTSLLGRAKGEKTSDFGAILRFKPLFFQLVPTNRTKSAEKVCFWCFTTSHQV